MASMNNWLGFSLSPQEIPSHEQNQDQHHSQISATAPGDCFDLASPDSTMLPSLNLPAGHFGILEAFNATRNTQSSSQDWNSKGVSRDYKNSMMLMERMKRSSCNNIINPSLENQDPPKLENFLGGHSFSASTDQNGDTNTNSYIYHPNNPSQTNTSTIGGGGGGGGMAAAGNNSTIGLSMIKNWLRNNPSSQSALPQHEDNLNHDQYFSASTENMNFSAGGGVSTAAAAASQNLSLSMSTGSQSTSALPLLTGGGVSWEGDNGGELSSSSENKQPSSGGGGGIAALGSGGLDAQSGAVVEAVPRKSIDTFGQRTSIYRGVTRHRWTGRYEAHLWDNSCRREGQTRKGRQVYLGGYDKEEKAARAYDLAALKYWGTTTTTNFPISNYEKEVEEMKHMTRQEYVASLRRKSSGFSRGASIYRGVTRHHQHGRWQARIGRVAGNKDLYLGTFSTQEEAAEAYDIAAIKFRGLNAVTNFEISRYDVKTILESSTLPIGGAAKRLKDAEHAEMAAFEAQRASDRHHEHITSQHLADGINSYAAAHHTSWPSIAFQQAHQLSTTAMHYPPPYGHHHQQQQQRLWCKQETDSDVTVGVGHSFQEFHQLQLANTHSFIQPSVLHNLMSLDSSSIEHSSGSNNSVMYSNGGGQPGENGYGSNSISGYLLPTVVADHHQEAGNQGNEVKSGNITIGYENQMYGENYPTYQTRNLYYHQPQQTSSSSSNGTMLKAGGGVYDHLQGGASCNTWVPTAVPSTLAAARANSMAVCHGSSTFTVWNDT